MYRSEKKTRTNYLGISIQTEKYMFFIENDCFFWDYIGNSQYSLCIKISDKVGEHIFGDG